MTSSVRHVVTEDPQREQWRLLSPFLYPSNVRKYLADHSPQPPPNPAVPAEQVAGSIAQAREYYAAARRASLNTSPLLLYYGFTNLLLACLILRLGRDPVISGHGLYLPQIPHGSIGDIVIRPTDPAHGAASICERELGEAAPLPQLPEWQLHEVLARIPDIRDSFIRCYDHVQPATLPIAVSEQQLLGPSDDTYELERIPLATIDDSVDYQLLLQSVPDFNTAYLAPQEAGEHIILNKPLAAVEIGEHSVMGQKHLIVSRANTTAPVAVGQLTLFLMALYALGHVSRYSPAIWHPFVRNDQTGERLLIEHLLDIAHRFTPNLVLNVISQRRIQFVGTGRD